MNDGCTGPPASTTPSRLSDTSTTLRAASHIPPGPNNRGFPRTKLETAYSNRTPRRVPTDVSLAEPAPISPSALGRRNASTIPPSAAGVVPRFVAPDKPHTHKQPEGSSPLGLGYQQSRWRRVRRHREHGLHHPEQGVHQEAGPDHPGAPKTLQIAVLRTLG